MSKSKSKNIEAMTPHPAAELAYEEVLAREAERQAKEPSAESRKRGWIARGWIAGVVERQVKRWVDLDELRRDIAAQAKAQAIAAGLEGVRVRVTIAEPDKRGRRVIEVNVTHQQRRLRASP